MSTQYTDIHESSTPYCEKRHIHAEEAVKFPIYKLESVRNDGAKEPVGDFFYTWSTMKPDGTHIVQAMRKLPQLNMIDTRTGQVIGYRIKGGPDYSLVQTTMSNLTEYYYNVQANDKYIYAVYSLEVVLRKSGKLILQTFHSLLKRCVIIVGAP